jgi:hypothetical protein
LAAAGIQGLRETAVSRNSDELEGFKNPDKEKGGGADLRVLLFFAVGEVKKNPDKEKGGISRPPQF